jgi:hypothetical protein
VTEIDWCLHREGGGKTAGRGLRTGVRKSYEVVNMPLILIVNGLYRNTQIKIRKTL